MLVVPLSERFIRDNPIAPIRRFAQGGCQCRHIRFRISSVVHHTCAAINASKSLGTRQGIGVNKQAGIYFRHAVIGQQDETDLSILLTIDVLNGPP